MSEVDLDGLDGIEGETVVVGSGISAAVETLNGTGASTNAAVDALLGQGVPSPEPPKAVAPVAFAANTERTEGASAPAAGVDPEDELAGIAGLQMGDLSNDGFRISRYPVEKIKFPTGHKARICIISTKVAALKTHYNDECGAFLCFGGECCNDALPAVRYVFPVIQYTADARTGKIIAREMMLKLLAVGGERFEDLKTIQGIVGDITKIDLLVTCTDDKYQKVTFQQAGEAYWKRLPMARELAERWVANKTRAYMAIAKSITAQQYREKMGSGGAALNAGITGGDMEDLEAVLGGK